MSDDAIGQCSATELAQRLGCDISQPVTSVAASDGVLLLDVREDWERQIASIDHSLNIAMNDVPDRLDDIREAQGTRDLVVFCHTGKRSMVIARFLTGSDFERLINLTGGIDAWSQHIQASEHLY